MSRRFEGKTVLVTGGSRGIGAAIARRFAGEGAYVVIGYERNKEAAERVVQQVAEAGGTAVAFQADMGQCEQVVHLVRTAFSWHKRLDVLVNNAAVLEMRPLLETDRHHAERLFAVNVLGPLAAMREAAKLFGEEGCSIINISSGAATATPPGLGVYSASKAALEVLTRTFAVELGPRGVRVNAIAPGFTETDMLQQRLDENDRAHIIAQTPLRRLGTPEDIADAVLFLASHEARWITGAVIPVSGGFR